MRIFRFIPFALVILLSACSERGVVVNIEPGEKWWGAIDDPTNRRIENPSGLPFDENSSFSLDLRFQNYSNNTVPFLVSSHGRYIWSDEPFKVSFDNGRIIIDSEEPVEVNSDSGNLRDAFLSASSRHFPPSGILPPSEFLESPQYNTWIELIYNQNQDDILKYAGSIVSNGFPTGSVLMIDDNWQKHYGNYEFKPERFSDPKGMICKLHEMGFKVMLWVCPFVSPDSPEFRDLEKKGYLVLDEKGEKPAIINWWNGWSAEIDMSNPAASDYLVGKLKEMQSEYGVDGFKFDAGDAQYYNPSSVSVSDGKSFGSNHTLLWNRLAESFPYNEFRASWKMGGQAAVMRLCDKNFSWEDVAKLVPSMIAAGLEGHIYICPDMIGGGEFQSFLDLSEIDEELIVRSCQIHSMMPMMQFSVAPWRVLSKENCEICRRAALNHKDLGPYLLEQARACSNSGEPLVRAMDYAFPGEGFENCTDQYMLGDEYLVAPMTFKGYEREVTLPSGLWADETGRRYEGGRSYTIEVPIDRIPVFNKI